MYAPSHIKSVLLVSLGCAKNLVDSEKLAYLLQQAGCVCFFDHCEKETDAVIINTCGFINDAKEESIQTILFWGEKKKRGEIKFLFVMGCLSEKNRADLQKYIPETDAWFGKFDIDAIVRTISARSVEDGDPVGAWKRQISTPNHYSYIKISEGCNRTCSFCTIPFIVGKLRSREDNEILQEVSWLVGRGVKEFNIVAQDICSYGSDKGGQSQLPLLLHKMAQIRGVEWIRLHYAYPAHFPTEVFQVMRDNENICHYIDIPLQHNSDSVLSSMRRMVTATQQDELIALARSAVPDIAIRTTLMVGFPTEEEQDFEMLLHWVKKNKFEHVGAFIYSHEENTYAFSHYTDSIPANVKQERLNRLMTLQENISSELLQKKIGQEMKVVIDRREGDFYIGRSQWDSPEIDNEILIKENENPQIGSFYNVGITASLPYDLYGTIIKDK